MLLIPEYRKKLPASSDEGMDDAEYEEIPVKAATTRAVGATTNITLTQNSAYSLPSERNLNHCEL